MKGIDYAAILTEAFASTIGARGPSSGCGRVYVTICDDEHAKGIAKAAKKTGRIFQKKTYYGDRNAVYVGYDNCTGDELAQGEMIAKFLTDRGIKSYRTEHGD